jgi:hypothetical protein
LIISAILVFVYYQIEASRFIFDYVAQLKTDYGYLYSAISTAIFAGIIPYFYLMLSNQISKDRWLAILIFYIVFWVWRGVEVDLLYRFQSQLFGNSTDFITILKKVLLDQFVYTPFWSAPILVIMFMWRDFDFDFKKTIGNINKDTFLFRIPSVVIALWIIWIPAVSFVYSFPPELQIPIFNLTVCFWTLLYSVISKNDSIKNAVS